MTAYLMRSLRRQLRESRTLFLLTVVGVSLGVASVVAIQTLNRGALGAFAGGMNAVSGRADLSVAGTTPTLDETLFARVLGDPDTAAAWPLCRVDAAVDGRDGLFLDVVGFDIFAPTGYPLEDGSGDGSGDPDAGRLVREALTTPGWTAITPELAAAEGWAVGDTVRVSSGSRTADLVIGALVDFRRYEPLAPSRLALMDIAQAQALLARPGLIHQIDVVLVPGADPAAAAARLSERLGPGARVQTPEQRRQDARGLLAAFRMNLTALSLISVFVGVFLVLTSIQASLSRRRAEFGVLRAIGATRAQVMGLIVAEAGALGALGTAIGVPLGYAAALLNLDAVSGTLTSIYVLDGIERLGLPPQVVLAGLAVGLAGAVAGAVPPALDMSRRDTVALLAPLAVRAGTGRGALRSALVAFGAATAATAWFAADGIGRPFGGFVYGFVMMVCLPLLTPLVVRTVCGAARPAGLGPALSLRNLLARLRTTSFAVAALAVTVSMMVGITLLIGGFRATLASWLDVTIRADVYVTTESWVRAGNEAFLDAELVDALAARPETAAVETQRRIRVRDVAGERQIWVNGVATAGVPGAELATRLPLMTGDPARAAEGILRGGGAMIGEPLARKGGLGVGDTLRLAGPDGPVALPIVGVAYDYTSEGGTAFVSMDTFARAFGDGPPNNAALFLAPGADVDATVAALKADHAGRPLLFRSNRVLRAEVMALFDQTFAVTRTLQAMALLIAVCGVSLTLLTQARERTGELAVLRALGATRRQIFGLFLGEGVGMGALGLLMGLGGGIGLAALLIGVINRVWFGWTIRPAWPGGDLLVQAAAVLGAATAAAVYPALKAGLSAPGQLSRDDL